MLVRSRLTTLGSALLFAICINSNGRANQPSFTTIDVPGASGTEAHGINPQGDIVGAYFNATGVHGFLLSKGLPDGIGEPQTGGWGAGWSLVPGRRLFAMVSRSHTFAPRFRWQGSPTRMRE